MKKNTLWQNLNQPVITGKKRGVALVMVLIMLAVLSSMLLDFSYQTRAEIKAAKNLRDAVQAEYLARSSIEIERLLVAAWAQGGAESVGISLDQITQVLEQILNSGDISSVLGHASTAFNANGLGDLPGAMLMPSPEKESTKLNLNVLSTSTQGRQCTFQQLRDMVTEERYLPLFEKDAQLVPDPAGEFAGSVLDWSDKDTSLFGGTGPENDPYGLLEEAYIKKDAPFYSLDELQMVWGVGDDLFYTLADSLTVYGQSTNSCAVDIVDAPPIRLRTALCGCLANPNDIAVYCGTTPSLMDAFISSIQPMRSFLPMIGVNSWQSFTQLQSQLTGLLGGAAGGLLGGLVPQLPEIPWAPSCANVTFGARATTYTIRGAGEVGEVRVGIRAVVDLNQDRQQGGRFLYWRIE